MPSGELSRNTFPLPGSIPIIGSHKTPPPAKTEAWRSWWQNLLLVGLGFILALSLVEVTLRFYNPLGFRLKGDKIVLPVNKKEIIHHEKGSKLDRLVVVHRNSLGFRGPDPPADLPQWLSLITVGGSTTECLDLADNRTWPAVLGTKLEKDFQRVWLNNAGLSGHSSFGHLVLMEDFIIRLQPKVVLFLIGINDLGLNDPNRNDQGLERGLTRRSFQSLERFLASLSGHSEVASVLLNLKRYYFPKVTLRLPHPELDKVDLRFLPTLELRPEVRQAQKEAYLAEFALPLEERIGKLIAVSRENGIVPVLLTQPSLNGYGTDPATGVNLSTVKIMDGIDGGLAWELLEVNNDITRRVGTREQVLVVDLAKELPKDSRYFYDLMHFLNAGAEKVADIVHLRLTPLLAARFPTSFRKTGQAPRP